MKTHKTKKSFKVKLAISLMTLLFLLSSCEPVSYPELVKQEMTESAESTVMPESRTSVIVAIKPILGAVDYGYTISAADGTALAAENIYRPGYTYDSVSGMVLITVDNAETDNTYNITVYAFNSDSNAAVVAKFENYTVPKADISAEAPSAFISKIDDKSVEISIENEISAGNMDYLAVYTDKDGVKQEKLFQTLPMTITNFTSGDITVYQKYKAEDSFNKEAASTTLSVSDDEARSSMSLTLDGSNFVVSNLPENAAKVEIRKITSTGEAEVASAAAGEAISYPVFDYGIFKAVAIANDGNEVAVSNSIFKVLPINKTNEETRQQSYVFSFEVAPSIDLSKVKLLSSIGTPAISQEGNIVTVTITGLTSKLSYSGNVSFTLTDTGKITIPVEFTTASFAGNYSWSTATRPTSGKYATHFAVIVKDAPSKSNYKYYIYADPAIESNAEDIRLMPILDNLDNPAYNTDGHIDYIGDSTYQKSYRWNNEKWNSSSFTPIYWFIDTTKTVISGDSFISETISAVKMFKDPTEAPTETKFILSETDGERTLEFFNKVGGGLALFGNMFLYKNPDADSKDEYAPYTFTLSYTGAAE